MDGFLHALSAVSVLLMLMSVGYFMGVKGWMTTREKRGTSLTSQYHATVWWDCWII